MDEARLRDAAMALVGDDRGVRVEDYLTALAAVTGEAALAAAGFDVEGHELPPGSALFFEPVNEVLSGDQGTVEGAPPGSVVGIMRDLVPADVPADAFLTPHDLYTHVAATVSDVPWGEVALRVPDDNRPSWPPLRAAFELRPDILAIEADDGRAVGDRHVLAATALREAVRQVAGAIDVAVAARLVLEVTWGMAKTAPMTWAAFETALHDEG